MQKHRTNRSTDSCKCISAVVVHMAKPGPAPSVTPEEVLGVFDERKDSSEPLTAPEIADALGVSRRTVYDRLDALRERGELTSKKVGGRSRVWWVPTATADEADWREGFGAFCESDSEFGEYALEEREALNADFEERQRDLF